MTKDGISVSGRSIMGLMMMGVGLGTTVELSAHGKDADAAIRALLTLIAAGFHEDP